MSDNSESKPNVNRRIPVVLNEEDNRIVTELQYVLSRRAGRQLPITEIVRTSLRILAEQEGLLCQK